LQVIRGPLTTIYWNTRQWYCQSTNSEEVKKPKAQLEKAQIATIGPVNLFVRTGLQCQDTKKK
jgi:hypothetical protein